MSRKRVPENLVEVVPASIHLPMHPRLDEGSFSKSTLRRMKSTGATSPRQNLEGIEQQTREIIDHFRKRYVQGDEYAVFDLLRVNPEFCQLAWVKEALRAFYRKGGFLIPKSGRPRGRSTESHLVGLVVTILVDSAVKDGRSKESIFRKLAERGFENLSCDSIKQLYYQTYRDPRLAPLLFTKEEEKRVMSQSEAEEWLAKKKAVMAKPGMVVELHRGRLGPFWI